MYKTKEERLLRKNEINRECQKRFRMKDVEAYNAYHREYYRNRTKRLRYLEEFYSKYKDAQK